MPIFRAEINTKPYTFETAYFDVTDESAVLDRAKTEYKVKPDCIRAWMLRRREYEKLQALESGIENPLPAPYLDIQNGNIVEIDFGEGLMCFGDLTDKQIKPLESFGHLRTLSLRGQLKITDAGLHVLRKLKNLETLILDEMQIGDGCLPYIKSLKKLRTLYLGKLTLRESNIKKKRTFTDAGLKHLKRLPELFAFSIDYTDVEGRVFRDFDDLSKLEYLSAEDAPITDDFMLQVKRMPFIKKLTLSGTSVTDAGIAGLSRAKHLTDLYLDNCEISDAAMAGIARLGSLQYLGLSGTKITDIGIEHFENHGSLQDIGARDTEVTKKAYRSVRKTWLRKK